MVKSQELNQLSYKGMVEEQGIEPWTLACKASALPIKLNPHW
jgi:hypothetical protein